MPPLEWAQNMISPGRDPSKTDEEKDVAPLTALSPAQLYAALRAAASWLEAHAEAINAINVFPVPDGDTGTNMSLTLRSTLQEAAKLEPEARPVALSLFMEALARGAIMGARGNSGVILSQLVLGLAKACQGKEALDASALAQALEEGTRLACQAIGQPREGTVITVAREAAQAARALVEAGEKDLTTVMAKVAEAAREAVERTPQLLPVLAEAGVVDAGGQGLWVILEGMARHLRGEPLEAPAVGVARLQREWVAHAQELHAASPSLYGYCTEFLLQGEGLDPIHLRSRLQAMGDSVVVVGDERMLRAHVHTDDPGAAISLGTRLGELLEVKVDNIRQQADRFLEWHQAFQAQATVVAVANGQGLIGVLRSMGAKVVPGGPTMNPSVGQLLEAIEACPTPQVIILPNDKNIIPTAHQAAQLSQKQVAVVPTRTIPQGIAALLAYNPERSLDENVPIMEEAANSVRTIEVARAIRDAQIGGYQVRQGEVMAIVDGQLMATAATPDEALRKALQVLGVQEGLLTLYYGADTDPHTAQTLANSLQSEYPGLEVETVDGGQPHYYYIASLE